MSGPIRVVVVVYDGILSGVFTENPADLEVITVDVDSDKPDHVILEGEERTRHGVLPGVASRCRTRHFASWIDGAPRIPSAIASCSAETVNPWWRTNPMPTGCGGRFDRWVTPEAAERDLATSGFLGALN